MSYKFYIKTHPGFSPKTCDKIVQHMSRKEVPKSLVWNTDRAKTQSHSINDSVVVKDIGLFLKKRGNLKSFAKKKYYVLFGSFCPIIRPFCNINNLTNRHSVKKSTRN